MKYIPSWFPGAGFKLKAARWRQAADKLLNLPFDRVKACLVIYIPPVTTHVTEAVA